MPYPGAILGMQKAYRSNIDQIKKHRALDTRKKYLGYKNSSTLDTKKMSEKELADFLFHLKQKKLHDIRVSIIVFIVMTVTLGVILFLISSSTLIN